MRLKKDYKIALATGANKEAALYTITNFGLEFYFDYVIAGNEVKRAKPDPEIFLKAAEGFSLKPEECVVIEDAIMGIKAAKKAGIAVIVIPDKLTMHQKNGIADMKLNSISELSAETLSRLYD